MMPPEFDFAMSAADRIVLVSVLASLFSFFLYWYGTHAAWFERWSTRKWSASDANAVRLSDDDRAVRRVAMARIAGGSVMGLLPWGCLYWTDPSLTPAAIGLAFYAETALFSALAIVVLSALLIPVAASSAKKPKNHGAYPQMRVQQWTSQRRRTNAATWAFYLVGYEIMFRGVLLFPVAEALGVWPAVAINVALYASTHMPKGMDETLGAIPLGALLSVLSLYTGTIWVAVVVHIVLAWTNSFVAMRSNPSMTII